MKKGFTLIEVLISSVIIALLISPLVATFYQSALNFKFARDSYLANNLLLSLKAELKNSIKATGDWEIPSTGVWSKIGRINYVAEYRTDIFDFIVESSYQGLSSPGIAYNIVLGEGEHEIIINELYASDTFNILMDDLENEASLFISSKRSQKTSINVYAEKPDLVKVFYRELSSPVIVHVLSPPNEIGKATISVAIYYKNDRLIKKMEEQFIFYKRE